MRALVVYESMFGNTKAVAEAVAEGVGRHMSVELMPVVEAGPTIPADVGLVVAGGPTHAHGLSRPSTRKGAADDKHAPAQAPAVSVGIREWLTRLAAPKLEVAAAAFDTRFDKPKWLTGSAAKSAEQRLRSMGFRIAAEAESFFVADSAGPLVAGELDRARTWAAQLAAGVAAADERRLAS